MYEKPPFFLHFFQLNLWIYKKKAVTLQREM